jgi:hypothetical protein
MPVDVVRDLPLKLVVGLGTPDGFIGQFGPGQGGHLLNRVAELMELLTEHLDPLLQGCSDRPGAETPTRLRLESNNASLHQTQGDSDAPSNGRN